MSVEGSDPQSREGKKSQKVSDSHRNNVSPLTQGLRYRAACDTSCCKTRTVLQFLSEKLNNRHCRCTGDSTYLDDAVLLIIGYSADRRSISTHYTAHGFYRSAAHQHSCFDFFLRISMSGHVRWLSFCLVRTSIKQHVRWQVAGCCMDRLNKSSEWSWIFTFVHSTKHIKT